MKKTVDTKFIVVAGGVISGVGKGVTTASIGKIIKKHGFNVTLIKIDPYINYDAGTLRPTEHGEVWVTEDGGEIDQDLGVYERFLNQSMPKKNSITTGQIYQSVIDRERQGGYLGQTVQFIPHITDEIVARIKKAAEGYDVAIVEIGGIVGDYENVPFLLALKTLERELGEHHVAYVLVTYLPKPAHLGELKTRPTRQAICMLGEHGILPDFIICRSEIDIDDSHRKKIEIWANIPHDRIISAPDTSPIYRIPLDFEAQQLGAKILAHFEMEPKEQPNWRKWEKQVQHIVAPKEKVTVAIVGKYKEQHVQSMADSYVSIYHGLIHAGAKNSIGVEVDWIDATTFEKHPEEVARLQKCHGMIVPGGFGAVGVEGMIKAITYVRNHGIPFFGICYGMQLAIVEFARNVCGMVGAHSAEVDDETVYPVIDILPFQKELLEGQKYGGTMRLGAYEAVLTPGSIIHKLYDHAKRCTPRFQVSERHRHRYEVNPEFVPRLQKGGMCFSGYHERADKTKLMEFCELPDHPFFVATQAHPEFKSRFGYPSPLFDDFVRACLLHSQRPLMAQTGLKKTAVHTAAV